MVKIELCASDGESHSDLVMVVLHPVTISVSDLAYQSMSTVADPYNQ
jgi:hypothetical protein